MTGRRNHLLCLGYGYSARALAAALDRAAWSVSGTVRTRDEAPPADDVAIIPFADAGRAIASATHLLISAPPGEDGDPVLNACEADIVAARPRWIGYLSTTGVYGDTGGRLVDESAPLAPSSPRSRRRAAAERAWRALADTHGLRLQIFRLAGIYGPGRSALDQVRAGTARRVIKPGHAFGRIHVDDIAQILIRAMDSAAPETIFNLCDDEPAEPAEVVAYACDLLGAAPPPPVPLAEAEAGMSAMARSFWRDNRRVDNARMKRALGVQLRYPSYREGLAAILAAENVDLNER